jgi:hypothetical protein
MIHNILQIPLLFSSYLNWGRFKFWNPERGYPRLGTKIIFTLPNFIISPKPNRICEWNVVHLAPATLLYFAINLDTLVLKFNLLNQNCKQCYWEQFRNLVTYECIYTISKYSIICFNMVLAGTAKLGRTSFLIMHWRCIFRLIQMYQRRSDCR